LGASGNAGAVPAIELAPPAPSSISSRSNQEHHPYLVSWKVAARSLILPGWGQFYLGETGWGQGYLAGAMLGASLGLELVRLSDRPDGRRAVRAMGWGIYAVSAVLSASRAWHSAEQRNRENGWELSLQPAAGETWALALRCRF
jgi:hypothetical protein